MAVIETHGLTRKFGNLTAVENLDLEMQKGEVLGFLGPNGAGKTTTIRMLTGIISPTLGYAIVAGCRTDTHVEQLHEKIGLLTESPGFYDRLSAMLNLKFYAGFYSNIDMPVNIEKYLKMLGLWDRRDDKVGTFSKGMKQRLALARALIHDPLVLFLDEPTAGLDPEAADTVRKFIKGFSEEGRTVFLSTHNLSEAEQLCQKIAVFHTRLLAVDTPANLRASLFRREVTVKLESIATKLLETVKILPFIKKIRVDGNTIVAELNNTEKDLPDLVQGIVQAGGRIAGVSEQQHSLEEVYLTLVREEKEK